MGPTGSVAWERAMKIQEVILRAMAKRITWWQAAEIIGISERQMRRWHRRYEQWGYDGLWDRRRGGPRPRRGPLRQGPQSFRVFGGEDFCFKRGPFFGKKERGGGNLPHLYRGEESL